MAKTTLQLQFKFSTGFCSYNLNSLDWILLYFFVAENLMFFCWQASLAVRSHPTSGRSSTNKMSICPCDPFNTHILGPGTTLVSTSNCTKRKINNNQERVEKNFHIERFLHSLPIGVFFCQRGSPPTP